MTEGFAIKAPNDQLHIKSARVNEQDSKDWLLSFDYMNQTWEYYESIGYRCVPVLITEVKGEK